MIPTTPEMTRDVISTQCMYGMGRNASNVLAGARECWPEQDWSEFDEPVARAIAMEKRMVTAIIRRMEHWPIPIGGAV